MESITGVHDKQFQEREVSGKVRMMTYNGCKGKFDVEAYSQRFLRRRRELEE
jgi:deoxyribodipyrimidine photo-lyase